MSNPRVEEEARKAVDAIIARFLQCKDYAVIAPAPAGAGKSSLVRMAVRKAAKKKMRLLVTAPTNAQVRDLAAGLSRDDPKLEIACLHASNRTPEGLSDYPNIKLTSKAVEADHAQVLIATLDKLAFSYEDLSRRDGLIIDEAYQADSAKYYFTSDLADHHLLVGDEGQLAPFTTADPGLWRGLDEDPLLTAVGVLLRNHKDTFRRELPITRRLPPSAVSVVRAFYPRIQFEAATLPEERELTLAKAATKDARQRRIDAVLDSARKTGWGYVTLPERPVLVNDPGMVAAIADVIERLMKRKPEVRCEKQPKRTALRPEDCAIAVSHTVQRDLVSMELRRRGISGVEVNTANRLQGLEFQVLLAWHPLAGLRELDEFHLDPGRLCVMLTRHRHACIVFGRASDSPLLDDVAPPAPAFVGYHEEPLLDGFEAHRAVLEKLEAVRCELEEA